MLALAAEDIDFAAGKVTVLGASWHGWTAEFVFKAPKGGKERTVPLPSGLAAVLAAHIKGVPAGAVRAAVDGGEGQAEQDHRGAHVLAAVPLARR